MPRKVTLVAKVFVGVLGILALVSYAEFLWLRGLPHRLKVRARSVRRRMASLLRAWFIRMSGEAAQEETSKGRFIWCPNCHRRVGMLRVEPDGMVRMWLGPSGQELVMDRRTVEQAGIDVRCPHCGRPVGRRVKV